MARHRLLTRTSGRTVTVVAEIVWMWLLVVRLARTLCKALMLGVRLLVLSLLTILVVMLVRLVRLQRLLSHHRFTLTLFLLIIRSIGGGWVILALGVTLARIPQRLVVAVRMCLLDRRAFLVILVVVQLRSE